MKTRMIVNDLILKWSIRYKKKLEQSFGIMRLTSPPSGSAQPGIGLRHRNTAAMEEKQQRASLCCFTAPLLFSK